MLIFIVFLTTVLQGLLALVVFLKHRTSLTNVLFAAVSVTTLAWALVNFVYSLNPVSETSLLIIRAVMFCVVLQNTAFFLFAKNFPNTKLIIRKRTVAIYLLYSAMVAGVALSPYLFTGVVVSDGQSNPTPGPLIPFFIIHAAVSIIGAFISLFKKYNRSKGVEKNQLRFILIGSMLNWIIVPITNFGITLVVKTTFFVQFGPVYTLLFAGIIGYAIIAQKLFDIRAIVARSLAYTLSLGSIGIVFGLAAFGVGGYLSREFGNPQIQFVSDVVLALSLAAAYQPVRRFFQKITDKIFYRDKYDSQQLINEIGRILAAEIELGPLSNKIVSELVHQMRLSDANIVVLEGNKVYFDAHQGQHEALSYDDLRHLARSVIVADEMVAGERKEILKRLGVSISLALRTSNEFVGFLFLGEKLSGDIYTEADIKVLQIIANELAVGVQNAKAYSEIQQFNETLQAKVDDATKRLRHANEELKELDQAKDEFISMASHQLRTPLTTTKGYVSMVLEGDFGKPTRDMKEPLTQALDSANRMARMVSDLLNVSRMDAGKFFIDAHDSDLSKVVPEEVNGLQTLAGSRQVALTYHEPKHKIPTINLDEDKMRQVIMNLIDNSIHYSNATPGLGKTDVYLELDKKEVVFKVVDNGIGVPKAVQPKLFGKFFRAGNAQKTRPDGTGLGLYLVKRVVEDHGGKIIFESTEGKGSTFGFRMPLQTVIHNDPKAMKRLAAAQVSAGQ